MGLLAEKSPSTPLHLLPNYSLLLKDCEQLAVVWPSAPHAPHLETVTRHMRCAVTLKAAPDLTLFGGVTGHSAPKTGPDLYN